MKEISPKTNSRLSRIKKLSRFLKTAFLVYFAVVGLALMVALIVSPGSVHFSMSPIRVGDQSFNSWRDVPPMVMTFFALCVSLSILATIAVYRLLSLYEKGIIFSAENVSQIRRLGQLGVFYGVLEACLPALTSNRITSNGIEINLTLPLDILSSPWFIVGFLTLIIAWIMDEWRKIQEEQELTV